MKNKKLWIIIAVLAVAAVAAAAGLITKHESKPAEIDNIDDAIDEYNEDEEMDFGSGIEFDEEADGAEISFADAEESKFYGSWKATSDQAIYLYGNVDITINEDKTWTGTIVDEDMKGTWEYDGQSMKLSSEFFNVTLSFTPDGTLVMQEDREGDEEYLNTVLTKQ